jgi:nudix-type nucleoside diphosphatase (YffH/AdpP family)
MDLFIFGTLLHIPLLKVVTGDADVAHRLVAATRAGYTVSRVDGQVFPMIHPVDGGVANGVIVQGLDDLALARLDYYEKAFGYDRVEFVVMDAQEKSRKVTAYLPEAGRWSAAEPWDCDAWIARFGELTTMTAVEAMSDMDRFAPRDMGARYSTIMARAASRQRAAKDSATGTLGRSDVTVLGRHKPYSGFFNLEELDLTYRRFDGSTSDQVNRAILVGVDCAILLPYDPVRDRVLVVEQFRPGAFLRGDPNPWTIEPIAGRIDPGEDPEDAARREALEEAGITITDLHSVAAAYPSPGSTTELFYTYVGLTDLPDGAEGLGGLASEAEDIRSHIMDWDDFEVALNNGTFRLMPLLVTGLWLACNRDRLRAFA